MIVNKDLKDLSREDLSQRYSGCFVHYDDEVVFVNSFGHDDRDRIVMNLSPITAQKPGEKEKAKNPFTVPPGLMPMDMAPPQESAVEALNRVTRTMATQQRLREQRTQAELNSLTALAGFAATPPTEAAEAPTAMQYNTLEELENDRSNMSSTRFRRLRDEILARAQPIRRASAPRLRTSEVDGRITADFDTFWDDAPAEEENENVGEDGVDSEPDIPVFFVNSSRFDKSPVFDWKKLNIERPRPRWHMIGNEALYMYYTNARQYQRGHNTRNTFAYSPYARAQRTALGTVYQMLVKGYGSVPMDKRVVDIDEIFDRLKVGKNCLVTPQLLFSRTRGSKEPRIYYRNKPIGRIDDKAIVLEAPAFKQEILEVTRGFKIVSKGREAYANS